jgi:hypothetical protein
VYVCVQAALGECAPWVIGHDLHILAVVLHANTSEPREKRLEEVTCITIEYVIGDITIHVHCLLCTTRKRVVVLSHI